MLVEPNLDVMLHDKRVGNKFALVTLTLKRARQLNDGSQPQVFSTAKKPVSVALYEIYDKRMQVIVTPPEEMARFPGQNLQTGQPGNGEG